MKIEDNNITLVPAELKDREMIYNWMVKSNITPFLFEDGQVPSWEEFLMDYVEYYFDGSSPGYGGGFMILIDNEPVGFISYASFHVKKGVAEIDIWMSSQNNCGKGTGSTAVRLLCEYLKSVMDMEQIIILPSINNPRAIRAYEKAGFVRVSWERKPEVMKECLKEDFLSETHDYNYIYSNRENLLLVNR